MLDKVIVICEYSGIIRDAFISKGIDTISCDFLPTEQPGPHIQKDCRELDYSQYDLVIANPPCTHLATSGARWFKDKQEEQLKALDFIKWILKLPVKRLCLENPISIISTRIKQPTQIIQPYEFGEYRFKKTCLWLKNLPNLIPTDKVDLRLCIPEVHTMPQSKHRGKLRSKTYLGIAKAMAEQWYNLNKNTIYA